MFDIFAAIWNIIVKVIANEAFKDEAERNAFIDKWSSPGVGE